MARREWLRLHFEYANGALDLVKIAKAARPVRRSPMAASPMTLTVLGSERLDGASATAQADTCCVSEGAAAHDHPPRYVFEVMALPDDQVRLTYPQFDRTYRLDALERAAEPIRRAPTAEEEDVEKVRRAATSNDGWIVVALANGFSGDGMTPFLDQVRRLETDLKTRPPFDHFARRIHVVPVRTPSPSNTLGPSSAFGHTEEMLGPNWFRFFVDQDAVARFMRKNGFTHDRFQPLVVANTTRYGGSGGAAAVFSLAREATEIAIHEIGHSEFGLSDEYSNPIDDAHLQPFGPNVQKVVLSGGGNPFNALKWKRLVTASRLPCLVSPASLTPDETGFDGVVGAFEGGLYQSRDVYRPQLKCAMRGSGEPFCAVCSDVIGERLSRLTAIARP